MTRGSKYVLWAMVTLPLALALPRPASATSSGLSFFDRELVAGTHSEPYRGEFTYRVLCC